MTLILVASVFGLMSCAASGPVDEAGRPKIIKRGTIDCDIVETGPVVFKDHLYRFEYIRKNYWGNTTGDSYFRFIDIATGEPTPPFARGYHLGSAFVEGNTIYVLGTNTWGGERVDIFASNDMKIWRKWNALNLPGVGIFNTSVCKAGDTYVMMYEIGKPKELCGVWFTAQFAKSMDLRTWRVLPPECNYAKDRYTAPHCLRYLDGYYYVFYLESLRDPRRFHTHVVRSKDFIHWKSSPLNPVLVPNEKDKVIANLNISTEQRKRISIEENCNASDIDFCEFQGRLIINYCWGDQRVKDFLAEAYYPGTEEQFLRGWFPE